MGPRPIMDMLMMFSVRKRLVARSSGAPENKIPQGAV